MILLFLILFILSVTRDSNTVPGEEIKITMDEVGNFSDSPWECNHVRRCMMKLIRMEKEKFESKQ